MPFAPLLMSWSGKGQLPVLTNAETLGYSPLFDGYALHSGYYLNELILKLLHRFDEHAELYDAYHQAIHKLTRGENPAVILRVFEKQLLKETGFGLILGNRGGGANRSGLSLYAGAWSCCCSIGKRRD